MPTGITPTRPGEPMGMSAPSRTRLVELLLEGGWVERLRDPDDQRALLVRLLAVGHTTLDTLRVSSVRSWQS